MEEGKIMLLMQLINALDSNFSVFNKNYNDPNKENFEKSKSGIIEIQKKIRTMLTSK